LVQVKNQIDKAWANIDVLLKQRNDELPNLVEAVKGYMKHEKKLLEGIARARTAVMFARSMGEKASASGELSTGLFTLFAVAENYPTLKASVNFIKLQARITGLENEIADRREFYNDAVTIYNTRIDSFPDLVIARMMKFKPREFFKAAEAEREPEQIEI
jgi:LemA protein